MDYDTERLQTFLGGGLNGASTFLFAMLSALTFGLQEGIVNFLQSLTSQTLSLGPFVPSYALAGSALLVIFAGGFNMFSFGADSEANTYSGIFLAALLVLMALPDFQSWVVGNQGISLLFFLVSFGAFSVIAGYGGEDDSSFSIPGADKISGGLGSWN